MNWRLMLAARAFSAATFSISSERSIPNTENPRPGEWNRQAAGAAIQVNQVSGGRKKPLDEAQIKSQQGSSGEPPIARAGQFGIMQVVPTGTRNASPELPIW